MSEPIRIVGFFWMERSDWDALLPHFTDRATLHATYEQWRADAEYGLEKLAGSGVNTVKVRAEPDEFLRWCGVKNLDINSNARRIYAQEHAAAQWFARDKTKH